MLDWAGFNRRSLVVMMGALSAAAALSACHAPGSNGDEDVSLVVLQLAMVPADVLCIEVNITGSQTVTQRFNVTPGQSTTLAIPNLTAGVVTIDERAFAVACASVVATTPPTWVAQAPVVVTLVNGQTVDLSIVMKRPPGVRINNDFQDGNGAPPSIAVVGGFDGFLFTKPCLDIGTGFDCVTTSPCPAGGAFTEQNFPIGGTAGTIYNVTFKVRGVVEAKNYSGGTRRMGTAAMDASTQGGDLWYTGGTIPASTYNSFELHVTPPVSGAANDYFINSRNGSGESHESWALNYVSTIQVAGGGNVRFRWADNNCRQMTNCGPGVIPSGGACAPRSLDLTGSMPLPPASFTQPGLGGPKPGQWIFVDVTAVN